MKLVLIFGDSAVGKMTVGQALAQRTDLKLFHNHMSIEPVLEIFGTYHFEAVQRIRFAVFEEFAKTDNYGLIFTFMWDFDQPAEWDYVKQITDLYENHGAEVYYVELNADLDVRLARNKSENRLKHKPSKRNLQDSDRRVRSDFANHRCQSREGELPFLNYLRINNTNIPPEEAARLIVDRFALSPGKSKI